MKQSNEDKSDMFSLGLIFHKMVFGCLPIDEAWGQDELTDFYRHSKKDGFKVQGLSDFSTNLIESMLMFDPLRRMEWEMLFLQTEETSKGEFTATTSHSASTNFETLGQNFYISQQSHNCITFPHIVVSTQQQVQSVQQDVLKRRTTNTSQLTEFSTKVTSSTQNLRISGKENMD
jgi:serine/threonine protein kinase